MLLWLIIIYQVFTVEAVSKIILQKIDVTYTNKSLMMGVDIQPCKIYIKCFNGEFMFYEPVGKDTTKIVVHTYIRRGKNYQKAPLSFTKQLGNVIGTQRFGIPRMLAENVTPIITSTEFIQPNITYRLRNYAPVISDVPPFVIAGTYKLLVSMLQPQDKKLFNITIHIKLD